MMKSEISIDIRYENAGVPKGRKEVSHLARAVLIHCCKKYGFEETMISVLFCSRKRIQELNNEFRAIDEETDILSFSAVDFSEGTESSDTSYLGDLAVCVPYVIDDVRKNNEAITQHMTLLFVHGFLHLLGHDHDTAERKKVMWAEQKERLVELDFPESKMAFLMDGLMDETS